MNAVTKEQAMARTKSKAERQAVARQFGDSNRAKRQASQRRQGPNVRVYESLGVGKGYVQVRQRDGSLSSTKPA